MEASKANGSGNNGSDVAALEESVRRYLTYVANPETLVDHDKVAEIEASLDATVDLIARLRLHAELERAKNPDASALRDDFIRDARKWAAANSVPHSAFSTLGLDSDVLRKAGLLLSPGRATQRRRRTAGAAPSTILIEEWIGTRTVPFTIRDAMNGTGFTQVTVSKVFEDLVSQDKLVRTGPDPRHEGRGRSPMCFNRPI
jgi:hypothetical protein